MPSKTAFHPGLASISARRASRSGTTLIRASRRKLCGSTRSAVPAQLLLTTRTSRMPVAAGAAAGAAANRAQARAGTTRDLRNSRTSRPFEVRGELQQQLVELLALAPGERTEEALAVLLRLPVQLRQQLPAGVRQPDLVGPAVQGAARSIHEPMLVQHVHPRHH